MQNTPTKAILFFLLCMIFIACAPKIPDSKELTRNLPNSFKNVSLVRLDTKDNQESYSPIEQIKLLFNDSNLHALFDIALENNLDVQITATRILQAQATLKSAWGGLFPNINANLNATEAHTRTNTTPIMTSKDTTARLSATLSWELDLFGHLRNNKNAKLSLYQKSLQDLEFAKITLLANVATLYFATLEAKQNILLTQENIDHYTTALELTRLKVKNGLLDSTELFTKQDLLTNEQNALESLKTLLEESQNALFILLNQSITIQHIPLNPTKQNLALEQIPATAILKRPDIKASLLSLYAQIYNKTSAKASLFPILSISANVSEILDSNTAARGNLAWQIASSLSAPILNRTQLTQNYFLQDALLQESYLTLQNSLKNAFYEIENASFNAQSTAFKLQNNQKHLQNAQNYYDFSRYRYSVGLVDALEHALNSASFNNAQKALNSAINEHLKAYITLYKAFGGALNLQANKESYAN